MNNYTTFDMENTVDIFNSYGDSEWGYWDEVHRCPYCDKLFFIRKEC